MGWSGHVTRNKVYLGVLGSPYENITCTLLTPGEGRRREEERRECVCVCVNERERERGGGEGDKMKRVVGRLLNNDDRLLCNYCVIV